MQGTLIALHGSSLSAVVYSQGKIYQVKLSSDLASKALPGSQVEFTPEGTVSALQVPQLTALPIACSLDSHVAEHKTIERDSSYLLCAEARTFAECYAQLAAAAQHCHANALLNIKGEYLKRRFSKRIVCRLCAEPGQVNGAVYQAMPGIHLKLPNSWLRRNSPSSAQRRYQSVLLICLLLIAEPCLSARIKQGRLPELIGYSIMGALPIFCLIAAILNDPCRKMVYLLQTRR